LAREGRGEGKSRHKDLGTRRPAKEKGELRDRVSLGIRKDELRFCRKGLLIVRWRRCSWEERPSTRSGGARIRREPLSRQGIVEVG